jgi:hypothetical protein
MEQVSRGAVLVLGPRPGAAMTLQFKEGIVPPARRSAEAASPRNNASSSPLQEALDRSLISSIDRPSFLLFFLPPFFFFSSLWI